MRSSAIAVGANALCGNSPITASPRRTDVARPDLKDHPGGFAAQAFIGDGAQRHDHVTEVQPAART